jgi:DNA-binding IclR family transcriptional regulator
MESTRISDVAVLDKVMAVLHAYRRGDTRLEPRTIAERTGLALPTVYRLLKAMARHRLLEKDGMAFRPGLALLHFGNLVADALDLRRVLMPHLSWLNERTTENAEMHVRRDHTRVPVEVVLSPQNLRPFVELGAPLPLHVGASSKVLLAWLPPDEALAMGLASRERFTPGQDFDELRFAASLRRTRDRGWAESEGERSEGIAAVAAPVFDADGEVAAAIALTGPSSRLPARRRRGLAPLVCEAAAAASRDAGYRDEPMATARGRG